MSIRSIFHCLALNLRYFGSPPWDTHQSPPELLEFMQTHPAGKALDIGCGTGTNCLSLARAGWQTTGIDLAWRAVWLARRRFKSSYVSGCFISGDILRADIPSGEYDLILDMGCYHSLPAEGRRHYRENVTRWLKPGGTFMIYGHRYALNGLVETSLSDQDIAGFQETLLLTDRKDCEERRLGAAIWLWFKKPGR